MPTPALKLYVSIWVLLIACTSLCFGQLADPVSSQKSNNYKSPSELELEIKNIQLDIKQYYQNKEFKKVIALSKKYYSLGGSESQIRFSSAQSYFHLNDFENAARELQFDIISNEKNNRRPEEERLLLLQKCYFNLNDFNANIWVYEKLVTYYPKKVYWSELLSRLEKRPDFREKLKIEILKLKLLTQTLDEPSAYYSLIYQQINLGFFADAKITLNNGISLGIFGVSNDQEKIKQLKEEISIKSKQQILSFNRNENELLKINSKLSWTPIDLGYAFVTQGKFSKGLNLIEKGIKNQSYTNRPQDAKLVYAQALFLSGQKEKAISIFNSISGSHGTADLSRFWIIYIKSL
jgi:hypothetical protein